MPQKKNSKGFTLILGGGSSVVQKRKVSAAISVQVSEKISEKTFFPVISIRSFVQYRQAFETIKERFTHLFHISRLFLMKNEREL